MAIDRFNEDELWVYSFRHGEREEKGRKVFESEGAPPLSSPFIILSLFLNYFTKLYNKIIGYGNIRFPIHVYEYDRTPCMYRCLLNAHGSLIHRHYLHAFLCDFLNLINTYLLQ